MEEHSSASRPPNLRRKEPVLRHLLIPIAACYRFGHLPAKRRGVRVRPADVPYVEGRAHQTAVPSAVNAAERKAHIDRPATRYESGRPCPLFRNTPEVCGA